jgi:radical SAM-linked protein
VWNGYWNEGEISHNCLELLHKTVVACFGSKRRNELMARQRVRIRFAKHQDLRLISHRDLMRAWERLFRRANVALAMSEGFHPKPKMMFPSALAVGIAGDSEALEIELVEEHDPGRLQTMLEQAAPEGLVILSVSTMSDARKTRLRGMTFEVEVPSRLRGALTKRIGWFCQQHSYLVTREGRATPLDLRPLVEEVVLENNGTLRIRLSATGECHARPREVLEALELHDLESQGAILHRTTVELLP